MASHHPCPIHQDDTLVVTTTKQSPYGLKPWQVVQHQCGQDGCVEFIGWEFTDGPDLKMRGKGECGGPAVDAAIARSQYRSETIMQSVSLLLISLIPLTIGAFLLRPPAQTTLATFCLSITAGLIAALAWSWRNRKKGEPDLTTPDDEPKRSP